MKFLFLLLVVTLLFFTSVDAFFIGSFVHRIPARLSSVFRGVKASLSNANLFIINDNNNNSSGITINYNSFSTTNLNDSQWDSKKYMEFYPKFETTDDRFTYKRIFSKEELELRAKLKQYGYEAAEDHEFKSPYIITPKIYSKTDGNVTRESGSKRKVISCFNCPSFFVGNSYNIHFKNCEYDCVYDFQRKQTQSADALLFFPGFLKNSKKPYRPPGQIWINAFWEAPPNYGYPRDYEQWKSVFNWTFNYRADSDIFAPVDTLAWRDRDELLSDEEYMEIAKRKTKTAAWLVSHCPTKSRREQYVKEMQKYIDIDIYGRCGPLKCGNRRAYEECEEMQTTTYKFYLAFENALCKDYMTEKFYKQYRYRTHVIPVGRGGFDYDKYLPPGGFVNAAHFKTAKDLALFLKKLSNDLPTYARMLKERDKLTALGRKFDWCDICKKLHTYNEVKTILDIKAWSHQGTCRPPNDIR